MMYGRGATPILFNKKMKIGRPEHSLTPHPTTSDNNSFFVLLPTSLPEWTSDL